MKCDNVAEQKSGKTKILLVIPNLIQAGIMKDFLECSGHEVIHIEDGDAVFTTVACHLPDIVILNRMLNGTDGIKICRKLKQDPGTGGIPIIVLNDTDSSSDKVAILTAGADDCIPKLCSDDELCALICARLRMKSGWDDLKRETRKLQEMLVRVEELANVDSLTGLFNRRRFEAVLATEFKRSVRHKLPLSCLVLDIDHFKAVNDSFGHAAGDDVLKSTVKLIRENIRDIDTAARWGGEEFIVLAPNTYKENAFTVAERIRSAMSSQSFTSAQGKKITISIGIAGLPDSSIQTMEQLIHSADLSLYEAKKRGRDQVIVAD